jgi:hypothetical protein
MIGSSVISAIALTILCLSAASQAIAQGLNQQVVGAWTLTAGTEQRPDGTKAAPWGKPDD